MAFLHDTKAEKFEAFAAAYNVTGTQQLTEEREGGPGGAHSFERVVMTLASFRAELFGSP